MVETERFDIFNVECDGFQIIKLCNKLEFATDALYYLIDIPPILIAKFCSPMRHDTSEDKVPNLKGAPNLRLSNVLFLINSLIVGPDKFAHNVNNVMIVAVGRGGT